MLLIHRKLLQSKAIAIENDLRDRQTGFDSGKCDRKGRYRVHKLIEKYGRMANLMKWREMLPKVTAIERALRLGVSRSTEGIMIMHTSAFWSRVNSTELTGLRQAIWSAPLEADRVTRRF